MAQRFWIGGAPVAQQVSSFTVAGAIAGDVYSIQLTAEDPNQSASVAYLVKAGDDVAAVASGVATAFNGSTDGLFSVATASTNGADVVVTASVAGRPFYATANVTGTGTFGPEVVDTASAGPNDYNTAANWQDGLGAPAAVPTGTDEVTISAGTDSILYGLDQTTTTPARVAVQESYAGSSVGDAANGYALQFGAVTELFIQSNR